METKLLTKLHKLFYLVGFFNLLSAVAIVAMRIYDFYQGPTLDDSVFRFMRSDVFDYWRESSALFAYAAHTFFAFLVGAIFKMLAQKKLSELPRAQSFQIVCSLAFSLQAFFLFIHWIVELPTMLKNGCSFEQCGAGLSVALYSTQGLRMMSEIIPPLLMAVAIYVLFKHFEKLLTFEAEVA